MISLNPKAPLFLGHPVCITMLRSIIEDQQQQNESFGFVNNLPLSPYQMKKQNDV